MIVATVALLVALAGTAFGGTVARLINGSRIKNHSISGKKLKKDTLTGAQIKESSLGTVPSAANAVHASTADTSTHATTADAATNAANAATVGGFTVRKISYAPSAATPTPTPTTILDLGGLTLKASCTGGGTVAIAIGSAVDHANFNAVMWNSGSGLGHSDGLHHADFSTTTSDDLTDGNAWGENSFTYAAPSGVIVNGQLSFESGSSAISGLFNHAAACLVSGFAMSNASS